MSSTNELRVLVLAAERTDADAVCAICTNAGIVAEDRRNIDDLCSGIAAGAGAAVIGQEALPRASFDKLAATLGDQPAWSDFPVILIACQTGGWKTGVEDILGPSADRGNFVVVQRPLSAEIFVTALRAALRARTRQYELRRAHEQLQEVSSRERTRAAELEATMEATPAAIFLTRDAESRVMIGNSAAYRLIRRPPATNLSKSAPAGEKPTTFRPMQNGREIPPDELPVQKAATTGQPLHNAEFDIAFDDGTSISILGDAVPLIGDDGRPRGAVGAFLDITERKRAEQALGDSEARLRALVAASSDVLYRMSPDWSEMRQLSGGRFLADTEGPSRSWLLEYIDPIDQPHVTEVINEAIRTKSVFQLEHRVRRVDGSLGWTSSRAIPLLDADGQITEWFGAANDITRRKQAEEALRESEERYRNLFESMDEGFASCEMIYDEAGQPIDFRYLAVNPAFARQTGLPEKEIVGRTVRELIPDAEQSWIDTYGRIVRTGNSERFNHLLAPLHKHFELFAWRSGPAQFAVVFTDVTDRKAAEERLRHAQKLESVGLLAGGIAHDFNNLLTVIMGAASFALVECPACDSSKEIVSAAERAAQLTKQLLAYAGKGQFIKKTVDISDLVFRSRQLLEVSVPKRINLVFNLAKNLPPVEDDPSRIDQILMNLVINAGEAIAPKADGRLEVSTGMSEVTPEAARVHSRFEVAPGLYVWLEVRDNGAGMDEATLSRIFDPFFSTKFTGRGLGLAAVDGIVRSSEGFIDVQSSPNRGSTFRVFLPASDKRRPAEVEAPGRRPAFRSVSTVLVVDDEPMVRKLAGMMLRRHGYEVLEANDGKHALRVLAESPSLPSLLLLDLAMPVMGGDELVPILAVQYPAVKVIISSGYPEEEARKNFLSSPVAGFLQKPYTAATLTDKLDEILGGAPRQPGQIIQFPNLATG